MGCSGSKTDETNDEDSHHIGIDSAYDKDAPVDLHNNPNKFVMECENFYGGQNPSGAFEDDLFPSNAKSLKGVSNSGNIEFKSAKEIWGDDLHMFGDKMSLEDIKLGNGNDAYFIAALASLAEFPGVVVQLFRTFKLPDDGSAVQVCLKIEGKWTVISMDDKFPIFKDSQKPVFADSPTKKLWGIFLEKAWAKVNGGWGNIANGYPREVFQATTPFSTIPINVPKENKDALWNNIKASDKYNCIMTCSIKKGTPGLSSVGLIENHSFSLVSAYENEVNGETYKLMKIRNPFGEGEWTGRFSDSSDAWTSELKEKFGFDGVAKNDGIFWIAFEDFIKYFQVVSICVPIRPLHNSTITVPKSQASKFNVIRIKITKSSVLSISIDQQCPRFHKDIKQDQEIIENLILAKMDMSNKTLTCVDSCYNETMSSKVDEGEYLAIVQLDYNTAGISDVRDYTVSISASAEYQAVLMEPDNDLQLLKSVMIPKIESLKKYAAKMGDQFVLFTGNRFEATAIGFMYLKNNFTVTKYVKPEFSARNLKSIEGDVPTAIEMPTGSRYFLVADRIKASQPFQTGCYVRYYKDAKAGAVKASVPEKPPEKYFEDVQYPEFKAAYVFSA